MSSLQRQERGRRPSNGPRASPVCCSRKPMRHSLDLRCTMMELEMLRGIRITSPDTVRIGEREYGGLRDYLVPWLQCEIYKNFFCGMRPVSLAAPISAFMSALSEANAGQKSFTA